MKLTIIIAINGFIIIINFCNRFDEALRKFSSFAGPLRPLLGPEKSGRYL